MDQLQIFGACAVIRRALAVVLLSAVLMIALLLARRAAGIQGYDRYWIDYDAPGVDITSEGP